MCCDSLHPRCLQTLAGSMLTSVQPAHRVRQRDVVVASGSSAPPLPRGCTCKGGGGGHRLARFASSKQADAARHPGSNVLSRRYRGSSRRPLTLNGSDETQDATTPPDSVVGTSVPGSSTRVTRSNPTNARSNKPSMRSEHSTPRSDTRTNQKAGNGRQRQTVVDDDSKGQS